MTTTITVENCASCPFYTKGETDLWCDIDLEKGRQIPPRSPQVRQPPLAPPDWCPLRTADRLVTLRVK